MSDLATFKGFPHHRYLVELVHDQSPRANYICALSGAALGDNLSTYDFATDTQTSCVLELVGIPNPDGSFDAYTAMGTWQGRLFRSFSTNFPANRVKSITPF